jgi:hypothetical protein
MPYMAMKTGKNAIYGTKNPIYGIGNKVTK